MRVVWITGTLLCAVGSGILWRSFANDNSREFVNSIGMHFVLINPGTFRMGNDKPVPRSLGGPLHSPYGDWDEEPVHRVKITHPYYIADKEVSAEQFRQFDPGFHGQGRYPNYATGISWTRAKAFCDWLSRKEKRIYRLPTEAEWEYACRAGTATLYWSGAQPPGDDARNPWNLLGMHSGPPEWVRDWYGEYPDFDQIDPVGPVTGIARVVRGGGIQEAPAQHGVSGLNPYYRRAANRASMIPDYEGKHNIGFRVVSANLPATKPLPVYAPFPQQAIKTVNRMVTAGPLASKPYYRRRPLLPIPPEAASAEAIEAAGLPRSLMGHNHSPGMAVCPNGDVFAILFSSSTSSTEYSPNTNFVCTRLRYGSDAWDMPGLFYDLADVNEQGSVLWTDNRRLWHFSGGQGLPDVPLRVQTSDDNGASWTPLDFAFFPKPPSNYSPQPITSAFRDDNKAIYVGSDGIGPRSLLWTSTDNGKTWADTGGRTFGRHTAFVRLRDGSILGLGGKNSNIDGFMPEGISRDNGRTWTESRTPFPALGSNQRPTLIRLASGRLFAAGDYQDFKGHAPASSKRRGAWVALSDNDGKTWTIKPLLGAEQHESHRIHRDFGEGQWVYSPNPYPTLGYTVARQSANGVIHLITSMNYPALDFELNEAWILDPDAGPTSDAAIRPRPGVIHQIETYANGNKRAVSSGVLLANGRYVLDGLNTFYYSSGRKEYEATFRLGRKIGLETYWLPDGAKAWTRKFQGARSVWTQYWPNGSVRSQTEWNGMRCDGIARRWNRDGKKVEERRFQNGELLP